jgi:dihydropteroate synthase
VTLLHPRPFYTIPLPSGYVLELGSRCLVMGILNVTPDSFANQAPLHAPADAVAAALRMEADGADLIDIGGESTRPGADAISVDEELSRVMPVLSALHGRLRVPISIDTYKAEVAREAVAAGAALVNDVSGLGRDAQMGRVVAETGAGLILMHARGSSKTMYAEARYEDVVLEVVDELRAGISTAMAAGVLLERVIVDPGVGFAKRPSHSYVVLARLPELAAALGRPVLIGPSRKSFLQAAVGGRPAVERDWGTAAAIAVAVLAGANIVRVHAVAEMAQVVSVTEEIRRAGLEAES